MSKDIICIRFGDYLCFGDKAIQMLNENNCFDQLIERGVFRLMGMCDLGEKWELLAQKSPTLFEMKDDTPIEVMRPMDFIRCNSFKDRMGI